MHYFQSSPCNNNNAEEYFIYIFYFVLAYTLKALNEQSSATPLQKDRAGFQRVLFHQNPKLHSLIKECLHKQSGFEFFFPLDSVGFTLVMGALSFSCSDTNNYSSYLPRFTKLFREASRESLLLTSPLSSPLLSR